MAFYKTTKDGYILSIGTTNGNGNITEEEYNQILSVIQSKPIPTEGKDYMLKEDLTWEEYELEPIPEPEADAQEIVDILTGEQE